MKKGAGLVFSPWAFSLDFFCYVPWTLTMYFLLVIFNREGPLEAIACLLLLLTSRWHRQGFSHSDFDGCRSVYFLSEKENLEVFIDGVSTGVKAPAMIYFPATTHKIFVEFRCEGLTFFEKEIFLGHPKTMVWGRLTPVISQMA